MNLVIQRILRGRHGTVQSRWRGRDTCAQDES